MSDGDVYIICFFAIFFICVLEESWTLYESKVIRAENKNKSKTYLDLFILFLEYFWVGLYWICFIVFCLLFIFF